MRRMRRAYTDTSIAQEHGFVSGNNPLFRGRRSMDAIVLMTLSGEVGLAVINEPRTVERAAWSFLSKTLRLTFQGGVTEDLPGQVKGHPGER